jgi:hypothetical protein
MHKDSCLTKQENNFKEITTFRVNVCIQGQNFPHSGLWGLPNVNVGTLATILKMKPVIG